MRRSYKGSNINICHVNISISGLHSYLLFGKPAGDEKNIHELRRVAKVKRVAELHVHTRHSDGRSSVREVLQVCLEKGIQIVSITDHDTINGSMEAIEIVREEHMDIEVLPGMEVTTSSGHLLVYGVEEDVEKGMSIKETAERVRELGGVTALAHPYQIERRGVAIPSRHMPYVDAVEVFNAKYVIGICNAMARKLAVRFNKSMIAGSDAHVAEHVGYGLTIIKGQVMESIRDGRTEIKGKKIPVSSQLLYALGIKR